MQITCNLHKQMDGQTDGRYQVHYLPRFADDKNWFLFIFPCQLLSMAFKSLANHTLDKVALVTNNC